MTRVVLLAVLLAPLPLAAQAGGGSADPPGSGMVRIPAGSYVPLYAVNGSREVAVPAFDLDRHPVTQEEYLEFVRANPAWRRSDVKRVFADRAYLADWRGDLDPGGPEAARRPTTHVSWFAARAYCEWRSKRLPGVDEWEYAALASEDLEDPGRDPAFRNRILALYSRPRPAEWPEVGSGFRNVYGVADLHGLVREWVEDFNSVLVSDDSRGTGGRDRRLFCASGANGATDTGDYAAFLRYAFRSGLRGASTIGNLGFRCARSATP